MAEGTRGNNDPKPTRPMLGPPVDKPRAMIQQTSRGPGTQKWRSWVDIGEGMQYAGEYGTYSMSRRMAVWKARRLLRKYYKSHVPAGPEIEV